MDSHWKALSVVLICLLLSNHVFADQSRSVAQKPQQGLGEAIGLLCGSLIDQSARNPELLPDLMISFSGAVTDLMSYRASRDSGVVAGLGYVCERVMEGGARQPEFFDQAISIYRDNCKPLLDALPRKAPIDNIATASSRVWAIFLETSARQPEAAIPLSEFRDECLADVRALGSLQKK
jgi:F0F1-type ATP synthase membrane subunit c/vacuolar-type H+-ATPase subunit K